jgi:proteasome lid subunit RPN8/RPN11
MERTNETGNEHAFVVCDDGTHTDVIEGESSSLDITEAVEACSADNRNEMVIFHTHPNGVKRLSGQDKRVASREDVHAVCAADTDGKFMCRTDSKCTGEVEL